MQDKLDKLTELLFKELENSNDKTKNKLVNNTARTLNSTLRINLEYQKLKANSEGLVK